MLANLLSWVIICFLLFSFGDMLLAFYNKICRRDEQYNFIDKLLLGLSLLVIPLSIWSLWLPSNQYFLLLGGVASFCYWIFYDRSIFNKFVGITKKEKHSLTPSQLILFLAFILSSLFFFSWIQDVYDSLFYHYQNIRWNEEYAVVPGIGNLDDRFGFNSNYFLLSALFTFRFFLGEAIYPLQGAIVTAIGCWVLYELFISRYEIKRVVILFSYLLLYSVSIYFLGNTSTDILPNFIIFYFVARILLYPNLLKDRFLINIILPVFLVTCKLSFFPFGFISLYLLYFLVKEKKYTIIVFVCSISLLIILPWLIRNVIVSGYLIYPIYQIDLFSFDWKISRDIAIKEKNYIFDIGYYFLRTAIRYPHMSIRDTFAINILTDVIYLLVCSSFFVVFYRTFKEWRKIPSHIYLLYIIFFVSLMVWATGGPDIRFVSGVLCAIILVGGVLFWDKKDKYLPKIGMAMTCFFIIGLAAFTTTRYSQLFAACANDTRYSVAQILLKPCSVKMQEQIKGANIANDFHRYPVNNGQFIWVSSGLPSDMLLPASIESHYAKFLPLECIEARGLKIQDGYRAKNGCK